MKAHFCEPCGREFSNPRCPRCGGLPATTTQVHVEVPVSDPDDRLDIMIEHASRPTLASLLKRGINSGLIKPTHDYQSGSTP